MEEHDVARPDLHRRLGRHPVQIVSGDVGLAANPVTSRQTAVPKNRSSGICSIVSAPGAGSRWENESTWVGPLSLSMNPVVWKEKPLSNRGAVSSWVACSNCTVLRWPG